MRASKLCRTAVLAMCALAALSACTSSSKGTDADSSNGKPPAPVSTAKAPTGTPIKIGLIYASTNQSANQGSTVAEAWQAWVNGALGGVNGHPVDVIVKDDQGSPTTAQAAGQTLVNSDKVVALVASEDLTLQSYLSTVAAGKVPVLSGTANESAWYVQAGLFETPTDVFSGLADQVAVAKQYGHAKKFADVYCLEDPACSQADNPLRTAATNDGLGFTSLGISATATDYTAECLKLQQEGVDYVQVNDSTDVAVRLIKSCQSQGYNPTFGATGQSIGPALLSVPNLTLYGPAYAFPSVSPGSAAATFRKVMASYAKGDNWHEGTASFTWTGLEALRYALQRIKSTPTRASITTALNAFRNVTLGGLVPNRLTYRAGHAVAYNSRPCAFVIGIKDGKTIAPAGMKTVCASK